MVDPLNPKMDPNNDPRKNISDLGPPPPRKPGGSLYVVWLVLLGAILVLGYYFYQTGTRTNVSAPSPAPTQTMPSTPAPPATQPSAPDNTTPSTPAPSTQPVQN